MRSRLRSALHLAILIAFALVLMSACYHYTFQQRAPTVTGAARGGGLRPGTRLVTYTERRPTYLNGFVGNGTLDTSRYCQDSVRTQLRVSATDVLIGAGTLLIYTPHTLSVTCEVRE
jgi:hypothetical protein